MYVWASMCVWKGMNVIVHMYTPIEARRGQGIDSWYWSYRKLWATCSGCRVQNSDPLQEQKVLLTTKPFLLPPFLPPPSFSLFLPCFLSVGSHIGLELAKYQSVSLTWSFCLYLLGWDNSVLLLGWGDGMHLLRWGDSVLLPGLGWLIVCTSWVGLMVCTSWDGMIDRHAPSYSGIWCWGSDLGPCAHKGSALSSWLCGWSICGLRKASWEQEVREL